MKTYCAYCGRLTRRCRCFDTGSALQRFMARGGRKPLPLPQAQPHKNAVPPAVKRRERAALSAKREAWRQRLCARYGERCLNCGAAEALALDHILPIAKGGRSRLDNLQLLCAECNRIKGKLAIDCRADKA